MSISENLPLTISLLRPTNFVPTVSVSAKSSPNYPNDLELATLVQALDLDGKHSRFVNQVLTTLETEPTVIKYRQEILVELLRLPDLVAALTAVLPPLADLAYAGRNQYWDDSGPLAQVARRLTELENYLLCVEGLQLALHNINDLQATGFLDLQVMLTQLRQDPDYQRLALELPHLRAQLNMVSSVTLGINLDSQFRPTSATILSINSERFSGKGSLLERLLGDHKNNSQQGLSNLYRATEEANQSQPEHQLFRELSQMLERAAQPVLEALQYFARLSGTSLAALEPELAFYLGAVKFTQRLQASGLSLCRPEIADISERACTITGVYSFDLALRLLNTRPKSEHKQPLKIVPNQVNFGSSATIFIVTGPNSGGKTTYTRAIGQAQILFQAGLMVAGSAARISPVAGIFTHFASIERPDLEGGRLAEELGRLSQIFQDASHYSLILLNEPLSSTDHTSAHLLSRDILGGLRLLGARAVYVTHIQELATDLNLHDMLAPDTVPVSLVAQVTPVVVANNHVNGATNPDGQHVPTYTIRPGLPQTPGYATELARQYGLNLAQIEQILQQRTKV
jgi:hypothetical protein